MPLDAKLHRVRLDLSYVGTRYCGWQRQPNQRSVQQTIETVLSKIYGEKIQIRGAGRTDTGVHATHQVAHTDLPANKLPISKLTGILNGKLPEDISVLCVKKVGNNFHSQKDAFERVYKYRIFTGDSLDPFRAPFVWYNPSAGKISIKKMRDFSKTLIGKHNFKKFSVRETPGVSTIRHMKKISIRKLDDEIHITFTANAFLRRMIRRLVPYILDRAAGKSINVPKSTAPGRGLCLMKVQY